jgi:hypothetical protein
VFEVLRWTGEGLSLPLMQIHTMILLQDGI